MKNNLLNGAVHEYMVLNKKIDEKRNQTTESTFFSLYKIILLNFITSPTRLHNSTYKKL